MQMLDQRLRKPLNERSQLLPIILLRLNTPTIPLKSLKPRSETPMLLDIALHEAFDARDALDVREKGLLLGVVVVVHGLAPALAVSQEVAGSRCVLRWKVRCLQVDGVEAADDAVVGEGHLGCDVGGGVGGLRGVGMLGFWDGWMLGWKWV